MSPASLCGFRASSSSSSFFPGQVVSVTSSFTHDWIYFIYLFFFDGKKRDGSCANLVLTRSAPEGIRTTDAKLLQKVPGFCQRRPLD